MKRLLSLLALLVSISAVSAQTVTLTFTGRDADNHYLPMNRVVIANVTQGWQETIYYPDTVFTMGGTGIADNVANGDFGLRQNNPNPFIGTTYATLQTTNAGEVILEMTDVNGRIVETQNFASLQPGTHQFRINVAAAGIYFLTARQNGQTSSIKMVNNGQGATNRIEYQNFADARNNNVETWCAASLPKNDAKNDTKGVATHPFSVGNDMIYTGYVTVGGTEYQSQMIHQNQFVSETFVLNFNASAPTGLPTVTTDAATNVLGHSATCGGNVTADGGYSVIARGVCWSTSPNPVFNDNHVSCGDGMGAFSGQLTGLEVNTTYYVRAYAVNSVGTAYGNQVSFTTNNVALPAVITTSVTNITQNSATCGGNVTADGGANVDARGVCWSTNQNPTIADSHTTDGSGTGSFTSSMTGLLNNTTYYVRAYAVNSVGTAYGNQESFTTNNVALPTVITTSITNISQNSATCGGTVTADGGYSVLARGVCWSTSPNPVFNDSHVSCGDGMGMFSVQLTGLEGNTTYYVRSYAVNSIGTAYGNQESFTTLADGHPCSGTPTVTDVDNNTYNTVQIGDQCWMKENLRATHYADGTSISLGSSTSTTTAYLYYPNNDSSNVSTYGYLYNWKAVMGNSTSSETNPSGVQGICPNGWHVPSDSEWTQLTNYVSSQIYFVCGSDNSKIAKALASTTGWGSDNGTCAVGNNSSANNATGFSAVPAGFYGSNYYDFCCRASFWSATQINSQSVYHLDLNYKNANVNRTYYIKDDGSSVRCLRD